MKRVNGRGRPFYPKGVLTLEGVREILRCPAACNVTALAARLGVSEGTVHRVRRGTVHGDILPELPRRSGSWPIEGDTEPAGARKWMAKNRQTAMVVDVLDKQRTVNAAVIAMQYKVRKQYIEQIRTGKALWWVLPELPRETADVSASDEG
jgi:hypothetical protein